MSEARSGPADESAPQPNAASDAPPEGAARGAALARLEARLGYAFRERGLLEEALIHRSFANERRLAGHNERLEFLGDAVLGLLAADWLYRRLPDRREGELARAKSALVAAGPLSRYAESLELGEPLRLGVGEARSGGSLKASLLGDALEAVWAAIYLDGGIEPARAAIERYLAWAAGEVELERDPKTRLQEWLQARTAELPRYAIVAESGPEHERTFVCEVAVRGEVAGRGEGRTKKEAQRRAAEAALARLLAAEAAAGGAAPAPAPGPEAEGG
jgi:ribonuclease-3